MQICLVSFICLAPFVERLDSRRAVRGWRDCGCELFFRVTTSKFYKSEIYCLPDPSCCILTPYTKIARVPSKWPANCEKDITLKCNLHLWAVMELAHNHVVILDSLFVLAKFVIPLKTRRISPSLFNTLVPEVLNAERGRERGKTESERLEGLL